MVENRFRKIRNVLLIVLVLNWLVAAAKVIYGYLTNCNSMAADGFHSFADGTSNIIGLVGISFASHPADKDHPYGHKKYETFTSLTIAMLLFIVSFNLFKSAIFRFSNPVTPEVNLISFCVMLLTLAVNIYVLYYERKKSKLLGSDILFADSEHTRSDILVSVSVIFTLFAIKAGFHMVDVLATFGISFLIAKAAVNILRESSGVLCDKSVVVSDKIREIVMRTEGVEDCHQIRTRGRTDDVHVDLHILVKKSLHVDKAHRIAETIEENIKAKMPGVTDVIVHIEPDMATERLEGR
ncbi:MAG: cation transporter [Candidatus Omnitrophica bacterium]|nr:cation transporter [Candidatus Omnitrophota bacterium]